MLAVAEREQLPVAAARAGSPAAWDVLFQRYQLPLYAYVFELIRSEQATLDIVQETFISAARNLPSLRDDDRFGSWLFSIAHRKCVDRWRKSGREEPLEPEVADALPADEGNPSELLIRHEQEAEFVKLIEQLPPPQRSALLLHFVEDFSLDEIAGITGAQLGTVKSRMHHAKRALRKLIEENDR
jgi:RNA polymerase sigma-70 factor (ECF subfamily)